MQESSVSLSDAAAVSSAHPHPCASLNLLFQNPRVHSCLWAGSLSLTTDGSSVPESQLRRQPALPPMRPLLFPLSSGPPGGQPAPCPPVDSPPAGILAELPQGPVWALEQPRVSQMGSGDSGEERAAQRTLQSREHAQRQCDLSKATQQIDGVAFARALTPPAPSVTPAQHTGGPPSALTST